MPLHGWLRAIYLLTASEGAASIRQIELALGITYKSAWTMVHRLRVVLARTNTHLAVAADHMDATQDTTLLPMSAKTNERVKGREGGQAKNGSAVRFEEIAYSLGCRQSAATFDYWLGFVCGAPRSTVKKGKNKQVIAADRKVRS